MGTSLHWNPEVFESKNPDDYLSYVNDPIELSKESSILIQQALKLPVRTPGGLLYKAPTRSGSSQNTILGLASFTFFFSGFQKLIGSLRVHSNFTGNIILGVSPNISKAEFEYLKSYDVTMYTVEFSACDSKVYGSIAASNSAQLSKRVGGGLMRGRCCKGLEHLKIEMARFDLARQWISACDSCRGWNLVLDTRDSFFQADPFEQLGDAATAKINLMLVEEIAPHSSPVSDRRRAFVAGNPRNDVHTIPCYGRAKYDTYAARPVLNSGTVIGTREGILRFLSVMVHEFESNNDKSSKCRSPVTTDQWVMNWLYYNGRFGDVDKTITLPWGLGPVQTLGKACMDANRKGGAQDLVLRDSEGFLVNRHEPSRRSAVLHQYDRCGEWVLKFMRSKPTIFSAPSRSQSEQK